MCCFYCCYGRCRCYLHFLQKKILKRDGTRQSKPKPVYIYHSVSSKELQNFVFAISCVQFLPLTKSSNVCVFHLIFWNDAVFGNQNKKCFNYSHQLSFLPQSMLALSHQNLIQKQEKWAHSHFYGLISRTIDTHWWKKECNRECACDLRNVTKKMCSFVLSLAVCCDNHSIYCDGKYDGKRAFDGAKIKTNKFVTQNVLCAPKWGWFIWCCCCCHCHRLVCVH